MADPTRLILAAAVGILLLLFLIIKFKLASGDFHDDLRDRDRCGRGDAAVPDRRDGGEGRRKNLQGIALLIGLGSMFGGILEISGGAQKIAQTLIQKFGQTKAGWALGLTGLVIGTTVFFEAGVVILIPLAFNVAKQTKKSTLCYAIPLLAGLASGYAFVPPSAGSVLVANALGVSLGTMIAVGIPVAVISTVIAGIVWGRVIGNKIFTSLPANIEEVKDKERGLPPFWLVLTIILIPLVLILLSTIAVYLPIPQGVQSVLQFLGEPFLALTIATLVAMYFLGTRQGYSKAELKKILDHSLRPVGMILLVIASRRRHPLDAGGFRAWQYHRAGIGAERNAADSGGLFDCVFGQGVGGKLHRGHDHGFRHYGRHACRGGRQRAL